VHILKAYATTLEEIEMRRTTKMILAGLALVSISAIPPALAGDLVANPDTIFAKGMGFSERNGENKGVIQLSDNGYAIIKWNGTSYTGRWEKVDEFHVKTIWKEGGPPGGVWSLRTTGNSASPYVAIRE
jgi:hypothetical protein